MLGCGAAHASKHVGSFLSRKTLKWDAPFLSSQAGILTWVMATLGVPVAFNMLSSQAREYLTDKLDMLTTSDAPSLMLLMPMLLLLLLLMMMMMMLVVMGMVMVMVMVMVMTMTTMMMMMMMMMHPS